MQMLVYKQQQKENYSPWVHLFDIFGAHVNLISVF